MNTLTLDYNGLALHASREAWFNATEIAEYHGKRLDNFFSLKRTQQYIQAVAKQKGLIPYNPSDLNPPKTGELNPFDPAAYPDLIRARRGRYGGTWLHPDSQLEVNNAALYMMGRPPAERDRELSAIARPALANGNQAA